MHGYAQSSGSVKIGAYYFDGWTGNNKYQLNANLENNFAERQPIWGWVTSTQGTIDKQIDVAASYGISFFNFCWYYDGRGNQNPGDDDRNNALNLYLKSANKQKLGFSLLVSNNSIYSIKAQDWDKLTDYWVKLFKDPSFVKIDDKPFMTFFSLEGLVKTFGSTQAVKDALDKLRQKSVQAGLGGVTIAVCVSPAVGRIQLAEKSGFDILTNYNYHKEGFSSQLRDIKPIDDMRTAEQGVWTKMSSLSKLPQIPTVTLNWDQRPTELGKKNISSRYIGFSGNSVSQAIKASKQWVIANPDKVTKEKIINVYAWNEYSEGAWLTPSAKLGYSLLDGVKQGLKQ